MPAVPASYAASARLSVAPMMDWTDIFYQQLFSEVWYVLGTKGACIAGGWHGCCMRAKGAGRLCRSAYQGTFVQRL